MLMKIVVVVSVLMSCFYICGSRGGMDGGEMVYDGW